MAHSSPHRLLRGLPLVAFAAGIMAVAGARADDSRENKRVEPASSHRVLPQGKLPDDARLGPLKNFDSYFPLTPPASREEWERRAQRVRRQVLVATGLWPMPTKTPANAVVHGRVDREGYTVEKVYFESFPGHFVSGNLYRPKGHAGQKLPGVLCPYGHWDKGRFSEASVKEIRNQIVQGAERFEDGGRFPLQARCVKLARMGCIVFHYDMEGYADSGQISLEVAHRLTKRRPEMDTPEHWGLFSVQAELHLQNVMGIQTYNSVRALDWLLSLPDVDPERIAVTGESGGGTQTFILSAIDPRVKVAIPAVMVSTAMQGGCTCENCCYLRVGTGNIELAGLIAPRPLCCIAADDWTHEIMTKGLPELKKVYGLYGAENDVMAKALLQFPHNYNYVGREVMYQWINKYFKLGLEEPVVEEDFKPLTVAEMSVWDKEHPRPRGGREYERSLLQWMTDDSAKQMAALVPKGNNEAADKQAAEWRRIVGGAIDVMVGRELPPAGAVKFDTVRSAERDGYKETAGLIRYAAEREELPAIVLSPAKKSTNHVAIWIDADGKAGLFTSDGKLKPAVKELLDGGETVIGVDLMGQGEFLPTGTTRLEKGRRVDDPKNSRDAACFTYGYNSTVFAQRVQDVLSAISAAGGVLPESPNQAGEKSAGSRRIDLIGRGRGAAWVAAAKAQARKAVARVALDTAGFRFSNVTSIDDPDFWPGAVKYGDLPALMALDADSPLHINERGEGSPEIVELIARFGAADEVVHNVGADNLEDQAIADFLLN